MMTDHNNQTNSNSADIKKQIEEYRMKGEWNKVVTIAREYTKNIDNKIGSKSPIAKVKIINNISSTDNVEAYHWVVLGEGLYHTKYDFKHPMKSLTNAIKMNNNNEANIICCRILLDKNSNLINTEFNSKIVSSRNSKHRGKKLKDTKYYEIDVNGIFGPNYSSLDNDDKVIIEEILASGTMNERLALLGTLSTRDHEAAIDTCIMMTTIYKSNPAYTKRYLLARWVLLVALLLLEHVKLEGLFDSYVSKSISEYQLWLFVDAVLTRSAIYEILDELAEAKSDLQLIVHHLLDQPEGDPLLSLSKFTRSQVLLAAAQLPLINIRLNKPLEAQKTYEYCIGKESLIRKRLPISLRVGLTIEMTVMYLRAAHTEVERMQSEIATESETDPIIGDTVYETPILINSLTNAFNTLSRIQQLYSVKDVTAVALVTPSTFMELMEHPGLSMLHLLPLTESDPVTIGYLKSNALIGTFIAAIRSYKQKYDLQIRLVRNVEENNMQDLTEEELDIELDKAEAEDDPTIADWTILELFEWALSLEITPSPDLLWNIANCYLKVGRQDDAINFLKQSHKEVILQYDKEIPKKELLLYQSNYSTSSTTNDNNNDNINDEIPSKLFLAQKRLGSLEDHRYIEKCKLLQWLGLEHQVSQYCWLAAARAVELLVFKGEPTDLLTAINYARNVICQLYGAIGKTILTILNDNEPTSEDIAVNNLKKKVLHPEIDGLGSVFDMFSPDKAPDSPQSQNTDLPDVLKPICSSQLQSLIIEVLSEEEGLRVLLFSLARAHILWAEQAPAMCDYDYMHEHLKAVRSLYLLRKAINNSNKNTIYPIEDTTVYYAMSLASIRQKNLAIKIIRKQLSLDPSLKENEYQPEKNEQKSRLLHLLVLLITSVSNEPHIYATAITLCKHAIRLDNNSWNTRCTLSLLEMSANEEVAAVKTADILLKEIKKIIELDSIPLQQIENNNNDNNNDNNMNDTDSINDGTTSVLSDLEIVELQEEIDDLKALLKRKREITTLLLDLSIIYKNNGNYIKTREVLYESYKILYIISDALKEKLEDISNNYINDKHEIIEIFKYVPTVLGWRLPQGCGWGAQRWNDCEANIIAECAELFQVENNNVFDKDAVKLYKIAKDINYDHIQSIVALANIELEKHYHITDNNNNNNGVYSKHLIEAERLSRQAISIRQLDSDAWYVFGSVLEAQGYTDESLLALYTSIKCQDNKPLRSFSVALW